MTIKIRQSRPEDGPKVIDIWKTAVDATHDFLSDDDREAIEEEVKGFLPQVALWLVVDTNDVPVGFMFIHESHMEALFVDASARGTGVGRTLIEYALSLYPNLTTDVNEQNEQAVGFYTRMGFQVTGRSELDGQGRAYPLLHLKYSS